MRPGCLTCVMLLGALLTTAFFAAKLAAAPGATTFPSSDLSLNVGDEVRLYLAGELSRTHFYVGGRLESLDGTMFCVRRHTSDRVEIEGHMALNDRDVVTWVPRANVLYFEKEVGGPTTQPTQRH